MAVLPSAFSHDATINCIRVLVLPVSSNAQRRYECSSSGGCELVWGPGSEPLENRHRLMLPEVLLPLLEGWGVWFHPVDLRPASLWFPVCISLQVSRSMHASSRESSPWLLVAVDVLKKVYCALN